MCRGLSGRWKAEISHATMYCGHTYNTLHPPGSLSRPNERHGCDPAQTGRHTSTPGSCLAPSGLLSLPTDEGISQHTCVYTCVCPCPQARTPLKRQLVVIKCNDMYMSTDSICVGSHLCCNASERSYVCLNHKIWFIRFQTITLSSLKRSQEPLALTSLPNEAVIEPPGSRLHISGSLLMKLAAGSTENRYISTCLRFAASVSLNVLKKQFTGNYSRTLC